MKYKLGKLDVDNLLPIPTDVKILSNLVNKEVVYDEYVKKVNAIDTSGLVKKNR